MTLPMNRCLRSCLISAGSHSPWAGERKAWPTILANRATCARGWPVSLMAKLGRDDDRLQIMLAPLDVIKGILSRAWPPAEIFFRLLCRVSSGSPEFGFISLKG